MHVFDQLLASLPWLASLADEVQIALPLLFLTSLASLGLLCLSARRLSRLKKRSSYDKGARQLLQLGSCAGLLFVIAVKGVHFWQSGRWFPEDMTSFLWEMVWILLCLCVIVLNLHFVLWKKLAKHEIFDHLLGMTSTILGLTTVFAVLVLTRLKACGLSCQALADPETLLLAQPALNSAAFASLLVFLPLCFVMPSVFGSMGFLFLRKIHDFGRDHYTMVTLWCMRRAFWLGLLIVLILGGCLAFRLYTQWQTGNLIFWDWTLEFLLLGLWFLAVLIWGGISRSSVPLRYKALMVFADLLALASLPLLVHSWLSV
ncbi:MAG: hypothetical protein K6G15_05740 [Desulfovibrio sp.]|nr:hypothetical protein [Desulfovibrio sp.]